MFSALFLCLVFLLAAAGHRAACAVAPVAPVAPPRRHDVTVWLHHRDL